MDRRRMRQRPGDLAVRLHVVTARNAIRQVRLERLAIGRIERIQRVGRGEVLPVLMVVHSTHTYAGSAVRSLSSPARMRVFTVPSG